MPNLGVRARRLNAVATVRAGRAAHDVISLVGSDDEERVPFIDAVGLQLREELTESIVVRLDLRRIARFPGTERIIRGLVVVQIGDVGISDRNAGLLHGEKQGPTTGLPWD
jgi:hypothetical protein